jgi:predicted acyltransferase
MAQDLLERSPTYTRTAGVAKPLPAAKPEAGMQRLVSLDAYRGLIMISLAFNGFGIAATAMNHLRAGEEPDLWRAVHYQFEHVEWTGCGYWDMIQPSFMFMVGVAMAFSYAKRRQLGHSYPRMLLHAVWRSVALVFLGIFLISNNAAHTEWSLMNVLTQIGLGYTFLFLLWGRSLRTQAVAAAAILVGTWLLYVLYPGAGIEIPEGTDAWPAGREWAQQYATGISSKWASEHLAGINPAWHKNANVGHAIDGWLLNLLPQTEQFRYNRGGYQTINFIPSLATMLFGLMCGELLRSSASARRKLAILLLAGIAGLALGQLLDVTGVCPIVKRIWTPAWALFSTGWCCLILGTFYAVVDVLEFRRWTFPLVVVGANSIAIYCMSMTLKGWTAGAYRTHFGPDVFRFLGPLNEPFVQATLVGLVFWLVCLWLYRNRVYVRI